MQFSYRAKQGLRSEASGVVEATDLSAAVAYLKQSGLYPLEVVPLETSPAARTAPQRSRPLNQLELALWARTVGQGLGAGLSLTQAMRLVAEQERGRPVGTATKFLEETVVAGTDLAEGMKQLGVFPTVVVSLVQAGEVSGALEQVLEGIAGQAESEEELISKVRSAMVYPLFVLLVGLGTVAVLLWVVVPKLSLLFTETGQAVPWMTQWLIQSGRMFIWVLLSVATLAAAGGWWIRRKGKGRIVLQGLANALARLPWFGRLLLQAEIARLSATLGLLLEHGLPLPESLRLVAGTIGRPGLRAQIQQAYRDVMEGIPLSFSLRRTGLTEAFLLTLVAMGEAQGDLARSFRQAGDRYRQEVDRAVRVLSTLIEPVLILVVGLIVGTIVFSMLLPIFQINFAVG